MALHTSPLSLFAPLLLALVACELPGKTLGDPNLGEQSTGVGDTDAPDTGGSTGQGSTGGDPVLCGADPQVFPSFDKQCASVDDCAIALHQTDCCGSQAAIGIDKDEVPAFDAAEAICAAQYPGCDCAPSGIVAEDGAIVQSPAALDLACTDGLCTVFVDDPCEGLDLPACPPACDPNEWPALCGQPCADEGAACGNNIGDGMVCSGGQWSCAVHPPLGPGCNLICK